MCTPRNSIDNFGALLQEKCDLAAAEPLCREAMEGYRENLGSQHRHTLDSVSGLAKLLEAKGDLAAASRAALAPKPGRRASWARVKQSWHAGQCSEKV